jgi:hypothetical protein
MKAGADDWDGRIWLTSSTNGVRMSYLAAMLASEGVDAEILTTGVGAGAVYRLTVRSEDAARGRAVLRALQAAKL